MQKDNRYLSIMVTDILVALVLWALLIVLRGIGVIDMHWALVLSSLVWITWSLFATSFCVYAAFFCITALVCFVLNGLIKLKSWHRRRKVDRRIIRQAKAAGIWDKEPIVLGGRALELRAHKEFKLSRAPGETDKELRQRCMTAADNEYAAPKRVKVVIWGMGGRALELRKIIPLEKNEQTEKENGK